MRIWRKNNPDKIKQYSNKAYQSQKWEQKQIAIFFYSKGLMNCVKCGFDDIDCLELDHINNDGYKIRNTKKGKNPYFYLNQSKFSDSIQVLCCNCNRKKKLLFMGARY